MKIVDPESGRDVGPGTIGEIHLRPAADAPPPYEYVGAEARTLPGGWESLGDMGAFDENGYLFFGRPQDGHDPDRWRQRVPGGGRGCDTGPPLVSSCTGIGLPDATSGTGSMRLLSPHGGPGSRSRESPEDFVADRLVRYRSPAHLSSWTNPCATMLARCVGRRYVRRGPPGSNP